MRRLPWIATLVVLAAVATMVALGLWQVGRAEEKERLLAQYEAAAGLPPVALPVPGQPVPLYRRTTATCQSPGLSRAVAGRNTQGQSGYSHWVECRGGPRVDIGWSARPFPVRWSGGPVSGTIAADRQRGYRLVADTGLAGLAASAEPNVADIPNNHRSYAFQWFAFAAAALIIFGLALRARKPRP